MLIPVRCLSCNNPVSRYYLEYLEYKKTNKNLEIFFNNKKIEKYCCRRILLTHIDNYKIIKKSVIKNN